MTDIPNEGIPPTAVNGGVTDSCVITVDTRDKVTVRKYYDYLTIAFGDGTTWESIGCDLSLQENKSGFTLWDPESYDSLLNCERRYVNNLWVEHNYIDRNDYSVQQLAYIYLFDPLGIEYYMRTNACDHITSNAGKLFFKDNVYKAIFGERSGMFYFTINNGSILYGNYVGANRTEIYSNAEILFGFHNYFSWSTFWESLLTTIFEAIPGVSAIQLGVEIYQALFQSGSICGLYTSQAQSYLEDYVDEQIEYAVTNKLGDKAKKVACWALNLLTIAVDAVVGATLDGFIIPNVNDIQIYDKIDSQDNYRAVYMIGGTEVSMNEIIANC